MSNDKLSGLWELASTAGTLVIWLGTAQKNQKGDRTGEHCQLKNRLGRCPLPRTEVQKSKEKLLSSLERTSAQKS